MSAHNDMIRKKLGRDLAQEGQQAGVVGPIVRRKDPAIDPFNLDFTELDVLDFTLDFTDLKQLDGMFDHLDGDAK